MEATDKVQQNNIYHHYLIDAPGQIYTILGGKDGSVHEDQVGPSPEYE